MSILKHRSIPALAIFALLTFACSGVPDEGGTDAGESEDAAAWRKAIQTHLDDMAETLTDCRKMIADLEVCKPEDFVGEIEASKSELDDLEKQVKTVEDAISGNDLEGTYERAGDLSLQATELQTKLFEPWVNCQ